MFGNFSSILGKYLPLNLKRKGNTVGEPYDYRSVMHNANNYLGTDRKKPFIMKLKPGGPIIGQRKELSELDARKINKFYGCKVDSSKYNLINEKILTYLTRQHINYQQRTTNKIKQI